MMRLLFLSNFYPPYAIGGYEQWCQEVATAFSQRGHQVTVVTSRYGLPHGAVQPETPAVSRDLYLMSHLDYYDPMRFLLRWQDEEAYNRRQLMAAIDKVQPDLLLIWGMWNFSLNLPFWAEQRLPGRVAYYLSSYWPIDLDPHRAYWSEDANSPLGKVVKKPLRQWALRRLRAAGYPPSLRFEHAVCCSHYVRDTLVAAEAVPPQTGVLLGGTDPAPFLAAAGAHEPSADGTLRLLYFGRLVHDKGVHTILEALDLLKGRSDFRRLRLTILGSGHPDYEARLRRYVADHQLAEVVTFVNMVQRDEVPQWLAQHDVFLFTSIWAEPMARSVMEAMAAGMVVIGSEVGGQREMLQNEVNSFTFAAGDAPSLAQQIARALAEPLLRARLAAAGQAMVLRDFTLERMVANLESWCETITYAHSVRLQSIPARY